MEASRYKKRKKQAMFRLEDNAHFNCGTKEKNQNKTSPCAVRQIYLMLPSHQSIFSNLQFFLLALASNYFCYHYCFASSSLCKRCILFTLLLFLELLVPERKRSYKCFLSIQNQHFFVVGEEAEDVQLTPSSLRQQ